MDMCPLLAGNFATGILADLGAQVIKVESTQFWQFGCRGFTARPTKDYVHRVGAALWGYPQSDPGPDPWNRESQFHATSRNKLSMTAYLVKPAGLEVFQRLIRITDVFVEGNSPPLMTRLGIDYPQLREINPALIMVRMPGYGLSGPYRDRPAMAATLEAFCGHVLLRGYPDVDPSVVPPTITSDGVAGAGAGLAALMALNYRNCTGKGQLVEMAQVENFMPLLGQFFMDYIFNKREPTPIADRHPVAAPCGCYPCAGDDQWVNITVHNDEEWEGFCRSLDNAEWTRDPDLATVTGRYQRQDEMDQRIAEWTRTRDKYEVMRLLQREGVPSGPVLKSGETFQDPQFRARGFFQELEPPSVGRYLSPGIPWKMSRTPLRIRYPAPNLGEHNEYVYKEVLGYTDEEYARLEAEGHIGTEPAAHIP